MTRSCIYLSVVLAFLAGSQRGVASVRCPADSESDRGGWLSDGYGCDFGACVADIHPFNSIVDCDPEEAAPATVVRKFDYRSGYDPVHDMAVYGVPTDAGVAARAETGCSAPEPSAVSTDCDEYTLPGSYDSYYDDYEYGYAYDARSADDSANVDLTMIAQICRRSCEGLWGSQVVVTSRNLMRHASDLANESVSHWDVDQLWRMVQEQAERLATENDPAARPISQVSNYPGLQESDPDWYGDCECWGFDYSDRCEPRVALSDLERLLLAGPRRQVALNVAERLDHWGQALQRLSGQIRGLAARGDVSSTSHRPSAATLK